MSEPANGAQRPISSARPTPVLTRRGRLPPAVRILAEAALLCGITFAVIRALAPWGERMPSARPTERGFSTALQELCATPGAPAREWRYIVIHHSATTEGGAAAFARYHVFQRGWDSLAYHFVIGNGTQTSDGEIELGPRWRWQREGGHAGVLEYNEHGIGICLVGDFRTQAPTELQMRSLEALIGCLMAQHDIAAEGVLGHRECPGAATECPGPNLDMEGLRDRLR